MAQIDATVSVEIDSVFGVGGWQELGLPDLAGISPDELAQRQVAARQDVQRGDQLALEQLAAAAFMRERGERADQRQAAYVAGAVVAFHGPDRHQQRRRHAELPLNERPNTLLQVSRSSISERRLAPHGRTIHFGTKRTLIDVGAKPLS
jgi:hypothetical protein